jgi:hypothetical protein
MRPCWGRSLPGSVLASSRTCPASRKDPAARDAVAAELASRSGALFKDDAVTRGFEQFFEFAMNEAATQSGNRGQ